MEKPIRFEDVLNKLDPFGKYQKLCFLAHGYGSIIIAMVAMSPIFVLGLPDYRCAIPGYNDTFAIQDEVHKDLINRTIPSGSQCTFYDSNMTEQRCIHWVYDETYFKPSAIMEFDLVCDKTIYRSLINMAYMIGILFGGLIGGYLADSIGRKKVICASMTLQAVSMFGMAANPYVYVLVGLRFTSGFFDMSYYGTASVWLLELVGASKRNTAGFGVYYFYGFGAAAFTIIPYLLRNWRHVYVAIGVLCALTIPYWWLIPESPRWLLVKGRRKEMVTVLKRTARINGRYIPDSIYEKIELENCSTKKENIIGLMKKKKLLIRLLIVCSNWLAAVTGYFGLSLNSANLLGDIFVNYLLGALIETPAYIFAHLAPIRFGRMKPHIFCSVVGGSACIVSVFQVFFGNASTSWTFTVLSTIGKFGATAAFANAYMLGGEMGPTSLRVVYIGICSMFARFGGMLAPLIADLGKIIPGKYSDALPLVIFGTLSIIAGSMCVFLPETYGRSLPETIDDAFNYDKSAQNGKAVVIHEKDDCESDEETQLA